MPTRRDQRPRRRPAGELLRRQPARRATSTSPTAARSATTTRCSSSCGGGCRAGSPFNASYQYALEGGSAFLGFHYGRVMNPDRQRAPRDQGQWDWTVPVGRGERFGTNMDPMLNGDPRRLAVQRRHPHPGAHDELRQRAALVGMTQNDLQKMYKFRHPRSIPTNGLLTPLHAAGRRDPQHAPGVQHRARRRRPATRTSACPRAATSRRPTAPTASSSKARRLRAADAARPGAVLHAPRHRRDQAVPDHGRVELRVARRRAEPVRQHQLHTRSRNPGPAAPRSSR